MADDDVPGSGIARSVTALGVDVLDAVTVLLCQAVVFALSLGLWAAAVPVAAALLPPLSAAVGLPTWVTPTLVADALWLKLLGSGLALAVARVLSAPPETMLTRRPGVLLVAPVLLLAGTVAALLATGATYWVLALLLAEFVLIRRTVHCYAGHVRTGGLPRWGRTLLGAAALVPLSTVTLFLEAALLERYLPMDDVGADWILGQLTGLGLPAQVRLGAARFQVHVLVLLALPPLVCGTYLVVQWVRGLSAREGDGRVGLGLAAFDGTATGWLAAPAAGSTAGLLWAVAEPRLRRSATGSTSDGRSGGADALPDSKSAWKYDDPEAERAHREARQRDPSEVVALGESLSLVLTEVDYDRAPPKLLGTKNSLVIFVEDAPDDLERLDTVCVTVTDYGGEGNSAEAVFRSEGPCE